MPDGIHVCTRRTSDAKGATRFKDIVSIVEIAANIGATANTYPYFMHCFTEGGAIDAGILFKNNTWMLYSYGSITDGGSDHWIDKACSGFGAGDTVQISAKVAATGNTLIVEAKKVGSSKNNTLTVNLTAARASALRNTGSVVAREMNIASHLSNINNEAAYFGYSKFKESTITSVANVSSKMTTSNSSLDGVTYDNKKLSSSARPKVKCDRDTPTTVNGYVVDRAWCRCNYDPAIHG